MKRRNFIKGAGAAVAGGLFLPAGEILSAGKPLAASDKLNIGVIGCNGMGWARF